MLNIDITPGTEINKIEEQIVKIRIPHTKFFVTGEKTLKSKWNISVFNPETNTSEIIKKGITTKSFALFSNIVLKTPFPYEGKEQTIDIIKAFIKKITKNKKYEQRNNRNPISR
ncbi:MAG: hypothetical protein WC069_05760 [Candidatus Shapirobacteria bacterium]